MSNDRYIFQDEKNEQFEWLLKNEIAYFKERVGLDGSKKYGTREEELVKRFVYENIMNVNWYKKRTKKEKNKRTAYIIGTVVLLLLIPFAIFFITYYLKDSELASSPQVITGFITGVLTSLLGLHNFFSNLIDNRKFLSQFHLTFTKLRNILFTIDGKWNKLGAGLAHGTVVSPIFLDELMAGTKESRQIVADDTIQYFEKLASPAFDIRSSLSSNAKVAKQLVKDFQAVDLDKRKSEQDVERERQINKIHKKEDQMESLEEELQMLQSQLLPISKKIEMAEQELADLEAMVPQPIADIQSKQDEIDVYDEEIEPIEWDLSLVNSKIEVLKASLTEERAVI